MSFLDSVIDAGKDILGAGAQALGGSLGGAAGNIILGSPEPDYSQAEILEQITLGNNLDIKNQKEMFDYRINQGVDAGMTPYEMYMGPAAGAGGGTTGSGQTLGNGAISKNQAQIQAEMQQRSLVANNTTALAQTKMQTDAQRDVAEIQAGTQKRGQDLQKQIADNVLSLNKRELDEVKIPQAGAQVGLSKQQLLTEINKTATSTPQFQMAMKQLSMGPANLLVELTLRDRGISLGDDSFMKLSEAERADILKDLVAMASSTYIEFSGVQSATEGAVEKTGNTVVDIITRLMTGSGSGIQATEQSKMTNPKTLGNYGPSKRGRKNSWLPVYKNFNKDFPGR